MTLASQNHIASTNRKHKIKWLNLIDFLLQTSAEKEILELHASELGLDQPLEDYRADLSK